MESFRTDNALSARLLVLKIQGKLNLAWGENLDRSAKPGEWNGACAKVRVDCGGPDLVEEVKELSDHIQVSFAKMNSLDHANVHVCRSLSQ